MGKFSRLGNELYEGRVSIERILAAALTTGAYRIDARRDLGAGLLGLTVLKDARVFGTPIGDAHECYVIAEVGHNHQGDIELAKRLIATSARTPCRCSRAAKVTK